MSNLILIFALGGAALTISLFVTSVVRSAAIRWRLTDRPDGHRKLHGQPTPLGGGISVLLTVWCTIPLILLATGGSALSSATHRAELFGFVLASGLIVLLGLLDDYYSLRGRHKLLGQIAIAAVLVLFGYRIQVVEIFGLHIDLGLLWAPVTVGWLLLAINALNLVDGIDGLASTVGIILSLALSSLAFMNGHVFEGLLLISLAGALLGFLRYNFPPAHMFLGDSGSMLIGLSLGSLSILGSLKGPASVALAAPLAVWTVPLLDTFAAIVRRKLTGRSIYATDRGHLHHRLFQVAGSVRRTLYLVVLACVGTATALASVWIKSDLFAAVTIFSVVGVFVATRAFGYGELQLLTTKFRDLCRSFTAFCPVETSPNKLQAVRLQGSHPWEQLWASLLKFTDDFDLARLRLDINIPRFYEDYHVSWVNSAIKEDQPLWSIEIPLCASASTVGRLLVTGPHAETSSCCVIEKLMEALQSFEAELRTIVARTTALRQAEIASRRAPAEQVSASEPRPAPVGALHASPEPSVVI